MRAIPSDQLHVARLVAGIGAVVAAFSAAVMDVFSVDFVQAISRNGGRCSARFHGGEAYEAHRDARSRHLAVKPQLNVVYR